ncbi:hypothetical protein BASA50_009715 [Batrachochytrium salamandrivorans]|uniref:Dipeptidylpeptidase IV N-terminal domain-containing protein n=1 Tax=Batrachochytrium salamandrivorans TaxID=1357716 RepID=A0ABQ8F0P3_9FUNG|nr:hypothetical protein BASA50_009715 [Batrachochytrium salamandrivorans]
MHLNKNLGIDSHNGRPDSSSHSTAPNPHSTPLDTQSTTMLDTHSAVWKGIQRRVRNYHSTTSKAAPAPVIPTGLVFHSDALLLLQAPNVQPAATVGSAPALEPSLSSEPTSTLPLSPTGRLSAALSQRTRRQSSLCAVGLVPPQLMESLVSATPHRTANSTLITSNTNTDESVVIFGASVGASVGTSVEAKVGTSAGTSAGANVGTNVGTNTSYSAWAPVSPGDYSAAIAYRHSIVAGSSCLLSPTLEQQRPLLLPLDSPPPHHYSPSATQNDRRISGVSSLSVATSFSHPTEPYVAQRHVYDVTSSCSPSGFVAVVRSGNIWIVPNPHTDLHSNETASGCGPNTYRGDVDATLALGLPSTSSNSSASSDDTFAMPYPSSRSNSIIHGDGNAKISNHINALGEQQLTFTSDPTISNGSTADMLLDGFRRSTALWWKPHPKHVASKEISEPTRLQRILYIQFFQGIDSHTSTNTDTLSPLTTPCPASHVSFLEDIRIVEFDLQGTSFPTLLQMPFQLRIRSLFPWCRYIVRAGWMPDGESVWAQLLDQSLKRTAVIRIPESLFGIGSSAIASTNDTIQVLIEEQSSRHILDGNSIYFLPRTLPLKGPCLSNSLMQKSDALEFIWTSERSGFIHLYLITCTSDAESASERSPLVIYHLPTPPSPSMLHPSRAVSYPLTATRQITTGDWSVSHPHVWIDAARKLVYFMGNKDSSLENHLYVSSYHHDVILPVASMSCSKADVHAFSTSVSSFQSCRPLSRLTLDHIENNVRRLTELGKSHSITMSDSFSRFATVFSSIRDPPQTMVFDIVFPIDPSMVESPKDLSTRKVPILKAPPSPLLRQRSRHQKVEPDLSNLSLDSLSVDTPGSPNRPLESWAARVRRSSGTHPDKTQLIRTSLLLTADQTATAEMNVYKELLNLHVFPSTQFITEILPPQSLGGTVASIKESTRRKSLIYERLPVPNLFTFTNSEGVSIHGMAYTPLHYCEGESYPTIVMIYNGRRALNVTNDFKYPKFQTVFMALKFGLAVVIVGSSSQTGRAESTSDKEQCCGLSEVQDQVEALIFLAAGGDANAFQKEVKTERDKHCDGQDQLECGYDSFGAYEYGYSHSYAGSVSDTTSTRSNKLDSNSLVSIWSSVKTKRMQGRYSGFIDMDRVAIQGWGRGGYLALMSVCHFPSIFKTSLVITPHLSLDSTLHCDSVCAGASDSPSSILSHVHLLPKTEHHRVLIVHDESEGDNAKPANVIVRALQTLGRPHHEHRTPSKEHSFHSLQNTEHIETLSMWWFQTFL